MKSFIKQSFNKIEDIGMTWRRLASQGILLLLFLTLTAIASRNVLPQLSSVIVGYDPDVFINPWSDWWTSLALSEAETDLWYTDYLFFPQGAELNFHSLSHLNTAVSLLLSKFIPTLAAYNLSILINYTLAGFFMYHLARYLTGSVVAGILAGILFAFNSHNIYQSAHPVLVSVWVIPLYTLAVIRVFREDSLGWTAFAAVVIFITAAAGTIMLVLVLLLSVPLFIFLWFKPPVSRPSSANIVVFITLSTVFLIPILGPSFQAVIRGDSSFYLDSFQTIPADVLGPIVPRWYIWLTRSIYVGIVPAFLAFVAFGRARRPAAFWFVLLALAYLASIGPEVVVLANSTSIILPWSKLFVPILRQTHRLNILVSLGLAAIVAYGWVAVRDDLAKRTTQRAVAAVMVGILLLDYLAAPFPTTSPKVPAFYRDCLPLTSDSSAIAIMPSGRQVDKLHMYYQTIHGRKMTGGHVSRSSDRILEFIGSNPLLRAGSNYHKSASIPVNLLPSLNDLASNGVGYLIFEKQFIEVTPWRNAMPWNPAYEDNDVLVYDLLAAEQVDVSELRACLQ